ncbi:MAG: hypothetical protein ACM3X0_11055 [Bacteroidota bacterium]
MNKPPENQATARLRQPHPASRQGRMQNEPAWIEHLPDEWLDAVEPPLYFEQHSEYEIRAERTVGYNADDRPCFTSHRFLLTSLASDDDDEFYEIVTYAEEMAAWHMRDGRWLVFRRNSANQGGAPRSFYAFSAAMPR